MKIAYLGTGSWGFCLATLLAKKGYKVTSWTSKKELAEHLQKTRIHPRFPQFEASSHQIFTTNIEEAVQDAEMVVESVTTAGIRPIFSKAKSFIPENVPIVLTSKGIELHTGKLLPEVVIEILGEKIKPYVGILSGPSFADEIIRGLPSSIVGTAYSHDVMHVICNTFTTQTLRVYPNSDILGVALVGGLKNAIAIACGIADGLQMGFSAKAALMTRGLHEIKKLGVAMGARSDTFSGLAGMGDLCMTSSSPLSRNFRFGLLIAKGKTFEEAEKEIGMVVEGAYVCEAALELSRKYQIPLPITEGIYHIIHGRLQVTDALELLMKRSVKEEHL